jgi:prepilin-type N-terminal cleavage/methylation domain-containing protein
MTAREPQRAAGFTLLEVILALAVLGLALATLGAAVRMSHDNADRAAREAEALRIAQSVLAELEAGIRPLTAAENVPWQTADSAATAPTRDAWVTSVALGAGPLEGLVAVRVGVNLAAGATPPRVRVEVTKWMPDPSLVVEEPSDQQSGDAAGGSSAAGAGSSGSGSSSQGAGS